MYCALGQKKQKKTESLSIQALDIELWTKLNG